jgi:hypothetical protein
MSTSPVRGKPPAAKSWPNLLDQIGKAWNELTAGKKPAAAPRPASNKPKPANQPASKHVTKTLTKTADKADPARQAYSDRVRREGTALQRQQAQELSLRLPQKTEFKQGKPNELEGLSNDAQLNIRKAEAFGSKLAHSRIIGVAQLGEGVGMATDAVKGLHGVIRGTPKFFSDAGDLLTGRTQTKPGEIDAGKLSGAGKFAWGAGAGLIDTAARVIVPGDWRDGIARGMQQGQQALDNGYRRVVKKIGIDPDSKAYGVASTATQVVGTLVSMGKGGKGGKGGIPAPVKTVKPVKVIRTQPRPGNPVTNPALRSAVKDSQLAKNANPRNPAAVRSGLDDVLAQVNRHMQLSEFKTKLAKSNSPDEVRRQNKAIQALRDDGKATASLIQPEGAGAAPVPLGRTPKSSNHPMTVAMKMRYFGNTVTAIANNTLFDNYLSAINGKPVSSVLKGSTIFNRFIDEITAAKIAVNPDAPRSITVAELTARYRTASVRDLPRGQNSEFMPHTHPHLPSPAHNTHTAFGAVSKLGEVMANTNALSLDLTLPNVTSWASRGALPGKGKAASAFWKVDVVKDWVDAEKSLAGLEAASKRMSGSVVSGHVQTLMGSGFLPKGSALAKHLGHIETTALARDNVFGNMPMAKPSDLPNMMKAGRALEQTMTQGLAAMAASAKQSRAHVMHQSFGTPATTYALTTRHAAAARYMKTIEAQPLAVFDANKYRLILKEVQMEAGPALKTGPVWHKQMLKTYDADHFFQDAMNANPALGQAWRDYKAQFGLK